MMPDMQVLKAGLPTRIKISDLEAMYRPLLPEKLQTILRHISEFGFVRAVMWAFQVPVDSYKIGRTRVFFRVGKIALLSELTALDMESDRGAWLAQRLRTYVMRIYWRRVFTKTFCDRAFVSLLYHSRGRIRAARIIQRKYRTVMASDKKVRQKYIRRKWRVAILAVRVQLRLVADYQLIKESNAMRIAAEEAAEASIREMDAREEQFELTEQEEEAEREAERMSLGIEGPAGQPPRLDEDALLEYDDENMPVMTRRRSASSVQHAMNKVRTEMQALVAASSLATVSVCLFRWTKIKLFMAFESWTQVLPSRTHRSRQFSSMRRGLGENVGADAVPTAAVTGATGVEKSGDTISKSHVDKGEVPTKNAAASGVANGPAHAVAAAATASKPNRPRTRTRSSSGGSKADIVGAGPGKVKPTATVVTVTGGKTLLVAPAGDQEVPPEGMCFECAEREAAVYCTTCVVDYCKVCTQFVHDSCKVMRSHVPMPMGEKKNYLAKLQRAVDKAAAIAAGQEPPPDDSDVDSDDDSDYDPDEAADAGGRLMRRGTTRRPRNSDGEAVVTIRRRKSLSEQRREGKM